MQMDVWTYPDKSRLGTDMVNADVVGYEIEALDGSIGKVHQATYDAGASYLVIDTGPWIFGKKVMLPAGVVRGIDTVGETVLVNRTKEQIKNAPEYDEEQYRDTSYRETYRTQLGSYYGAGGLGYREDPERF